MVANVLAAAITRQRVSALGSYILGVGGQNAANGQFARTRGIDRADFLEAVAKVWSQLDPAACPFTRSVAGQLRGHDDRTDFLAGIDLILSGITSRQATVNFSASASTSG